MRVEAGRGLVEQQDVRLGQQRGGEREPPARPERARADPAAGDRCQARALESLVRVAAAGAGGGERELVARGAAGMEAVAVQHAAHAPGRVRAARTWRRQPEQDPQRRRLARAVGAQEAADAPRRDGEAEPVDGGRCGRSACADPRRRVGAPIRGCRSRYLQAV